MPAKKSTSSKSTARQQKPSPRKKTASSKSRSAGKQTDTVKAGDCEIAIDRRTQADRRSDESAEKIDHRNLERREKVQRRRQIDPTTCERDYSDQEVEFMNAMDLYKRTSGRMFPTCSEVLEVIRGLGYAQLTPTELAAIRPEHGPEVPLNSENCQDSEMEPDLESIDCESAVFNA